MWKKTALFPNRNYGKDSLIRAQPAEEVLSLVSTAIFIPLQRKMLRLMLDNDKAQCYSYLY